MGKEVENKKGDVHKIISFSTVPPGTGCRVQGTGKVVKVVD